METNTYSNPCPGKFIDVICQHTRGGDIIPLKVRIQDEDGMFHDYHIKAYKEKTHKEGYNSPYGTMVHNHIWVFSCRISVFGTIRTIELFYNATENLWRLMP